MNFLSPFVSCAAEQKFPLYYQPQQKQCFYYFKKWKKSFFLPFLIQKNIPQFEPIFCSVPETLGILWERAGVGCNRRCIVFSTPQGEVYHVSSVSIDDADIACFWYYHPDFLCSCYLLLVNKQSVGCTVR